LQAPFSISTIIFKESHSCTRIFWILSKKPKKEKSILDADGAIDLNNENEARSISDRRKDFDRSLVIEERTDIVAKKLTEYLKGFNRFAKTIIFCVDIDHAERMRNAIARHNADLVAENYKYVMQITGDNEEGKRELDSFINPEEKYPVIALLRS
jgi:type I site-specific restriction endonuclease